MATGANDLRMRVENIVSSFFDMRRQTDSACVKLPSAFQIVQQTGDAEKEYTVART